MYISHNQTFLKSRKKLVMSFPPTAYGLNILTHLATEIFDERESLSSEINTDGSFESCDFDISKNDFFFGCAGELEYKEEELKWMISSDDDKSYSDEKENDLISIRANPSLHCTVLSTCKECKCCKELKDLDLWRIIKLLIL